MFGYHLAPIGDLLFSNLTAKLSMLAAWAALVVAVVAGVIAFRAYRRTAADTANGHMHSLFRDFLKLRYDFESTRLDHAEKDLAWLEGELVSFQLYTLEEMAGWVAHQRQAAGSVVFGPWKRVERGKREAVLVAWDATIMSHLKDRWLEIRANIEENSTCYGVDFLQILIGHPEADEQFKRWAARDAARRTPLCPLSPASTDDTPQDLTGENRLAAD